LAFAIKEKKALVDLESATKNQYENLIKCQADLAVAIKEKKALKELIQNLYDMGQKSLSEWKTWSDNKSKLVNLLDKLQSILSND
jgi:16S rRNA U1498 N3-methylase RsmE